jgi:hypothetical protein
MIHKTLDKKWRKRNPLKDMGDLWCPRKIKSSCSLSITLTFVSIFVFISIYFVSIM